MEIKAILNKPYTQEEYNEFIVEQNHKQGFIIEETETELQALGYTEEEIAEQEKARIQELKMTKSDFFDATIDAWGVNEDALLPLIQSMLAPLPLDEKQKLKAINNFKNAQNFYRKHDLFKMIVGSPIQLTENIQVVIEEEHLDKFFDEVDKGNKETAWQYLPQPVMIPTEQVTDQVSEQVSEQVTEVGETA